MQNKSFLKFLFLCFAFSLCLASCGQDYNSNSSDDKLGSGAITGANCSTEAGQRFCAAITIIKQRCYSCHAEWSKYTTDVQWVQAGLVTAGSSTGSKVVSRLINSGSDMPMGGSALPSSEYTALKKWVEGVQLQALRK